MPLHVFGPDGRPASALAGVTPLFTQVAPDLLRVIGTAYYVARYGLLLTAKHVAEEALNYESRGCGTAAWIFRADGTVNFRPILSYAFFNAAPLRAADIAIVQAVDDANVTCPRVTQLNERIGLLTQLPEVGTKVATFAYPGNHSIDLSSKDRPGDMFGDSFEGEVLAVIKPNERPLRYAHVETSMEIRSGASGGPVFVPTGRAFAVNCRGWEFDSEDDGTPLSSVVPISHVLDLEFDCPIMPSGCGEARSIPAERIGGKVTLRDLAHWGHVSIDEPVRKDRQR